ncbi:MAG TPA: LuxR C-terminal-related transcriptional regulator [Pyrinomonadaceae bacterium]|jgi:DNA-binding CsgD family transcriptional regulator/PAS domain-containing protein
MKHLFHTEVKAFLSSLAQLYSDIEPQTLPERTIAVADSLISNEFVAFDFFNLNIEYTGKHWYSLPEMISDSELEIFVNYVQQHPFSPEIPRKLLHGAKRISDFIPDREFHKTGIYNEFYKLYRIDHQLCVSLTDAPDSVITCALSRTKQDFSERDQALLSLLAPHLTNALRNALAIERLRKNEERLMSIVESISNGVIALDRNKKVLFISEHTATLLEKYFGQKEISDKTLPDDLQRWISKFDFLNQKEQLINPPLPFIVEKENSVLRINLMFNTTTDESTLILEEKSLLTPSVLKTLGLTKREAEILFFMAKGKTDKEIAILCGISHYTVQKHTQHIYHKLGVETRTAAMLRAIEVLQKIIH